MNPPYIDYLRCQVKRFGFFLPPRAVDVSVVVWVYWIPPDPVLQPVTSAAMWRLRVAGAGLGAGGGKSEVRAITGTVPPLAVQPRTGGDNHRHERVGHCQRQRTLSTCVELNIVCIPEPGPEPPPCRPPPPPPRPRSPCLQHSTDTTSSTILPGNLTGNCASFADCDHSTSNQLNF